MKKEIKSYIEAELRHYHQSKKDLEEIKEDIVEGGSVEDNMGIRSIGTTSDVVANKAIRLVTNRRIKKLEETINSIDAIMEELDETKYKLIELKYWTRPNLLTDAGISNKLKIGKTTYYRWKDAVLYAIAKEMGLVD